MTNKLSFDLVQDYMWNYALAFTVFDLDFSSAEKLTSSEETIIAFVARHYIEQRELGLYRRSASAANSNAWAASILKATSSQETKSGRSSFVEFKPNKNKKILYLDYEVLSNLFQLAYIVRNTQYINLYNALASSSGSFFQPDGSLDELFSSLDSEFGRKRDYFRVMALFELSHRIEQLNFANKTQAYTTACSIRRGLNEPSPRVFVASQWALNSLSKVVERYEADDPSYHTEVVRGLLESRG